jgi:hypothetical protein
VRRLELAHRVGLGQGIRVECDSEGDRISAIRVTNDSGFPLLKPGIVYPGTGGQLRGIRLPQDLPPRMDAPLVVRNPAQSEVDADQAFFGQRIVFRSARGPEAADRAQSLARYVRERVANYQEPVLLAWVDGGALPVQIARGDRSWSHVDRGLTLLVVTVPRYGGSQGGGWVCYVSYDVAAGPLGVAAGPLGDVWESLVNSKRPVSFKVQPGNSAEAFLMLVPPRALLSPRLRRFEFTGKLAGPTVGNAPPPPGIAGAVSVEMPRWTSDRRLAGWRQVFSGGFAAPGPVNPVVRFTKDLETGDLGPGGSVVLRIRVVRSDRVGQEVSFLLETLEPRITGVRPKE